MKKIMVAAAAAIVFGAFAADGESENLERKSESPAWRMTLGGFARGSMRIRPEGYSNKEVQGYGADADFLVNAYETGDFKIWTGIGFGWMPNQEVYNRHWNTAGLAENQKMDMQYGELRLLLVPEWQATESLALGTRLGAALDWVRCRNHWEWSWPPFGDAGTERYSDFTAQGIAGLQATYMFTKNLGIHAFVDARMGDDMVFKRQGAHMAKLDMSGWYAGCGMTLAF